MSTVPLQLNDQGRSHWLLVATIGWIVAGVVLLVALSQRVERTPDELNYQLAGRVLRARQPLATVEQRFQGPLILLGTQLTDGGGTASSDPVLRRARLGMLVFPLVLLVVLTAWTRQALGERAGLWVAFLAATNPTFLAYGPLLSSDMAFTAMAVLAGWRLWRWLQAPGVGNLLALGAALGAVAATKYTGLLTCFALVGVMGVAVLLGFEPWPVRSARTRSWPLRMLLLVLAVAAAAAIALTTLYAAYLFSARPFPAASAAELTSPAMRAVAALPFGATLLGLVPEPMVLGIDYQMIWAGKTANGTFLDLKGNHWAFYPVTVLCKTPLVLLVVSLLGLFVARRASSSRGSWPCALVPPFALLLYCSATRSLQMGIRYVLPVVPALLMLAGAFLGRPWTRTGLGRVVLAVVVGGSMWNVVSGWPHFIGFFNSIAGGSTGGYRICADGNCDWYQRHETGQVALRERHPDLVFLRPGQGPRLGRVAAYVETLKADDPRDATRTYHWLTRFAPFDHDGAAWFAYDVTPDSFAQAVAAGDRRAAEDLALAWLAQRDFGRAREALDLVTDGANDAAIRQTRSLLELVAAAGDDAGKRDAAARQLTAAGHFELALSLADPSQRANAVAVFWLMVRTGRHLDAIDFLETKGADGSRTTEEVVLLAASLVDGGGRHYVPDPMRALELMQRGPAPAAGSPWHGPWQALQARVRDAVVRERNNAGK